MATLLTRKHDDVLIAYFQDVRIIDDSRISSLHQEMMDLVTNTGHEKIVLNFQNVSFMSSAMLGKLIKFAKQCQASDVKLRLCNINENVGEVFKLMKLDKVFAIDEDEEKSIEGFTKKGWFG